MATSPELSTYRYMDNSYKRKKKCKEIGSLQTK